MKVYSYEPRGLGNPVFTPNLEDVMEHLKELDLGGCALIQCKDLEEADYNNLPEHQGW